MDTPKLRPKDFAADSSTTRSTKRILICDDNDELTKVLTRALNKRGHDADVCRAGEECCRLYRLALVEQRPYHYVLLDRQLGDNVIGEEVLCRLQNMDRSVNAILVTGDLDRAEEKEALALGFRAALRKPFTLAQLEAQLEETRVG